MYKENDPCKKIYIVYEGEFQLSKTVLFKDKTESNFEH